MARYVQLMVKIIQDKGEDPGYEREWWENRYVGEFGDADNKKIIGFNEEDIYYPSPPTEE